MDTVGIFPHWHLLSDSALENLRMTVGCLSHKCIFWPRISVAHPPSRAICLWELSSIRIVCTSSEKGMRVAFWQHLCRLSHQQPVRPSATFDFNKLLVHLPMLLPRCFTSSLLLMMLTSKSPMTRGLLLLSSLQRPSTGRVALRFLVDIVNRDVILLPTFE
jgi:hypothetical protein